MPDLTTYGWNEIPTSTQPSARWRPGMVWAGDRVILFGGGTNPYSPFTSLDDTWQFDSSAQEWTQLSPATTPPVRDSPVMVWDPVNERVLMHGGKYFSSYWRVRKDTWEYVIGGDWTLLESSGPGDPDGSWNFTNHMYSGCWDTANDRFLLNVGWRQPPASSTNRLYAYTSSWSQLTPSPAMQLDVTSGSPDPDPQHIWGQACMWNDVDELMYTQGGTWDTDQSNTATWEYDGTGFTQISGEGAGGTTPGAHRSQHQMVWATDRGFLFGGNEATVGSSGDIPSAVNYWFDGADWTLLSPAASPPDRYGHGMVWNGACAILFGGTSKTGATGANFDDTWMFCGPPAGRVIHIRGLSTP